MIPGPRPELRSLLARIRTAVNDATYLAPVGKVPPAQRPWIEEIAATLREADADPDRIRTRIQQLHAAGRIDRTMKLSALSVLAASPLVRDYVEAARLASQQELAALEEGGPWRDTHLASAARHRGVVTFLLGHPSAALDWFTRALELERTPENVGNVLAALVRLGELDEALHLVDQMRGGLPSEVWGELWERIQADDDLVRIREALAQR